MIDTTKPLELFNPTTGETKDCTFNNRYLTCSDRFAVRPSVTSAGWTDYKDDGTAVMDVNPWVVRNKVDVNLGLDLSKPLYVDGVRVYLIHQTGLDEAALVRFWQQRWDSTTAYINVTSTEGTHDKNTTFYRGNMKNSGSSISGIIGTISNNPGEIKMLDITKPMTVNGKDAKVVHTFDSGKLAVVVEGYGEIQHFDADGTRPFGGMALVNKVVETVRYVNVYPNSGIANTHDTLNRAKAGIGQQSHLSNAFMIKQTLIGGKVVKNELVD